MRRELVREDVEEEAANELVGGEGHCLGFVADAVILPAGSAGAVATARGPAHADLDQVPAKELGAENCVVVATASPGARTATGSQVLAEHRQINVAQACALIGHDMAKMRSRPQISHGRARAVALPFERCREIVEIRSARPAPQMSQHLRC